jgi:Fe-S oxidoreductase
MLENYMETLENCRFCLMCRHVEPVGLITDLETLTPHGIALIATSQQRGLIEWDEDTISVIYSEPDGGNSRAHCVFDQPHPEAVAAVRANLVQQKLAPAAVYETGQALADWETPFAAAKPAPAAGQGDVALFVGDEAQYLWPDVLPAVQKLLNSIGVDPVLIGNGRNNGLLATSLGFPETAADLVQATLAELQDSGAQKLLVLSPGDYFTFKQAIDERLGITFPPDVELLELVSLLAEEMDAGHMQFKKAGHGGAYVYVDPTHAVRHPARHAAARQLAEAVMHETPHELFFHGEHAHPVGSTHLQFSKPELAEKLTLARLQDAQKSSADTLLCEDPGTLYQLSQYAESFGFSVLSLYELLAENVL